MTKITIVKNYRNAETLKVLELSEAVRIIQQGEYAKAFTDKVPRICFASEMENRNHQRIRKQYTGIVLLEVNNLTSYDEAVAIRQGAALMPQTLLAFVGASGRSVKIGCRGELFDGGLPEDEDEIKKFHLNLYEKARMVYNAQLGVTIDKLEPYLERTCYIGADADLCIIYQYNLSKAYDDTVGITDEEERNELIVSRLAEYCRESGLDMAFCRRRTLISLTYGKHPDVVEKIFENAYREEHERQYYKRKNMAKPLKNIPAETLMMMKIDMFLNANYELRKNVMRGVAEYRMKTGLGFNFQDLTTEARNSITINALGQGHHALCQL